MAFARTLEAASGVDASHAAELAYHWYAAHDLPRALEAAVAAGVAAEARYAFPEALTQYERAIELWDHVPDAEARAGRDQVEILATLAGVARFDEPARAVAHIQSAIRLVDEADDPVRAGLLHERLGRYSWIAGQGELAQRAYETAMRLIPAAPPSEARARAEAGLAQILMLGGRFEASQALAEEALAFARAAGARDIEGHALNTRGLDRSVGGDIDGAVEDLRASLAIAEEVGIVDDIGRAYANWVWLLDAAGRLDEAVELAAVGIATATRTGAMRFFGSHMLANRADALYRVGRWEEAEQAVRRAERANPQGINGILVAGDARAPGHGPWRVRRGGGYLLPLATLAERAVDIQFIGPVQASLAEAELWQGRPDAALARTTAAIRSIEHTPEVRIGELYALGVRAAADVAEIARARRSPEQELQAVTSGDGILERSAVRHAGVVTGRPVFEPQSRAWLLLAEAEARRLHRHPDPDAWSAAVDGVGRGSAAPISSPTRACARQRRGWPPAPIAGPPQPRCAPPATPRPGSGRNRWRAKSRRWRRGPGCRSTPRSWRRRRRCPTRPRGSA